MNLPHFGTDPPNVWVAVYRIVTISLFLIGLWLQFSIAQQQHITHQEVIAIPTAIVQKIEEKHP